MNPLLSHLGTIGLIPVVRLDRGEDAAPLGRALVDGGLPCAEITFRTAAAEEGIRRLSDEQPDMIVGAGTVLTVDQAERAVKAGARFIVAPGFGPRVVDWCLGHDVLVIPGVATPTDIMLALESELTVLKFFPAEALGGTATLKALAAPFGMVRFVPTGGVNARNMADYLAMSCVHAIGGSWMVEPKLINGGHWGEITRLAAEACSAVAQART